MQVVALANGGKGLKDDRGSLGVWSRPPILLAQMSGYGDGSFADPIIRDFNELLAAGQPVQVFFEMGGMENYDSALRTRLTSHFIAHRGRIGALHVFTRSRLVAMGVAVANLALSGIITSHSSLALFQAALDHAIAQSKVVGLTSAALR